MTLLFPVIGLAVGILIGERFNNILLSLLSIGFSLAFYIILLIKSTSPLQSLKLNPLHRVWMFLLFLGIGWFDMGIHAPYRLVPDNISSFVKASGWVEECYTSVNGEKYIINVTQLTDTSGQITTPFNLKIQLLTDGYYVATGDIITTQIRLSEIKDSKNFRNSGYTSRMNKRGVFYSSKASSDSIKIIGCHKSIFSFASNFKNNLLIELDKSDLNRECRSFIAALLLGDKSEIRETERERYSNSGVAHILALSGTHIALLMSVILFVFYPFNILGFHKTRCWLCIVIIWGYTVLTGLSPSTVRASIMLTVAIIAYTLQRRKSPYNSLLLATFIILLIDPYSLFDVGLQLSVLSVAAILIITNEFHFKESFTNPFVRFIISSIMISLSATLVTWVVVSYYFGIIPLLFLPANLILLPLLPIFISLALFFICFIAVGYQPLWLVWLVNSVYKVFNYIVSFISSVDGSVIHFNASLLVVALWMIGLLFLGYYILNGRGKKKPYYLVSLYLLLVIVTSPLFTSSPPDSFIFQNFSNQISIVIYKDNIERTLIFPRGKISESTVGDNKILVVDSVFTTYQIDQLAAEARLLYPNVYLIIGGNSKIESVTQIPSQEDFSKILLHPSLLRRKERNLLNYKEDVTYKSKFYSLREEGPLEIIF